MALGFSVHQNLPIRIDRIAILSWDLIGEIWEGISDKYDTWYLALYCTSTNVSRPDLALNGL